jgi:putative oxidoreductase
MKMLIKFFSHPVTLATFKVLLGALFLLSSISKIQNPAKFMDAIEAYKLLPAVMIHPMAIIIPWLQIICGLFFIFDIYAQSTAFILSGLLVVYTAAIAQAFARGMSMDCGCFDLIESMEDKVGWKSIIRDLIFLGMSGAVFLFDKNTVNVYGLFKKIFK